MVLLISQSKKINFKMLFKLLFGVFLVLIITFECLLTSPINKDAIDLLDTPEKSEMDKKLYRLFKLKKNGLSVLLISTAEDNINNSDNDELLAQVGMAVSTGSINDFNVSVPGMAHFLEHMLFLGSKKYPIENDFDKFITSNGGSANAKTDFEQTLYYYFILENSLESSLDRFASLFTDPLLSESGMTREREAIESEFQGARENFYARYEQMLTSLVKPHHPSSSFSWGNLKSLKEDISDDELHTKIRQFYERHYIANRMYLCVQSSNDLDHLQDLVVKYFSDIPTHEADPPLNKVPEYSWENTMKPEFFDKIYYVKSTSDQNKLVLTWITPPLREYKTKSNDYVSFILGDESSGSLTSYFKKTLLATNVQVELSHENFKWNTFYTFHTVYITLTDQGYAEIEKVLEAVYSYLLFLQTTGPSEEFYNDVQKIKYNEFRFNTNSEYHAAETVVGMNMYNHADILKGPTLFYEYNEKAISSIYSELNKGKFNIMIFTNQVEFDKVEQWMHIDYKEEDIPESYKELWKNRKIKPDFHYPKQNQFISSNFEIYYDKNNDQQNSKYPEQIYENECSQCWYRLDSKFLVPKAAIYVYFQSPIVNESKHNLALLHLFNMLFQHYISDEIYAAKQADYDLTFQVKPQGIVLQILGYNEKIGKVLEVITKSMAHFKQEFDESSFSTYKKELKNECFEKVNDVEYFNLEIRNSIIETHKPGHLDIYQEIDQLTEEDMKKFIRNYLDMLQFQILIQGNIRKKDAMRIMDKIMDGHTCRTVKQPSLLRSRKIPEEKSIVRVKTLTEHSNNSAISNYYQIGENSIKLQARLELLLAIMKEPIFNTLRTKEQLGYVVSSKFRNHNNVLGFSITVLSQENKNSAIAVYEKIESFVRAEFDDFLNELTDDDFNLSKKSLIQKKTIADIDLEDEVNRNWQEVINNEHIFGRKLKIVDELKNISKSNLYQFYKENVFKRQALLSVQVIGDNHNSNNNKVDIEVIEEHQNQLNNFKYVDNINDFKDSLAVYPEIKTKLD